MVRLYRNTTTGAITQPAGAAGCVSETGAGPCADGHALDSPGPVAVSPDGTSVYVAVAINSDAVARFDRNTSHRGAHPARRDRRLHQRIRGPGRASTATRSASRYRWR